MAGPTQIRILISALLLLNSGAAAQNRSQEALLSATFSYGEGSILLNDGTELKGLIRYDHKTQVVRYEHGNSSGSYVARGAAGFEFFDEDLQRQRVFYAIPYEDSETNATRPMFFEVLKEYKDFAVLSIIDAVSGKNKTTRHILGGSLQSPGTDLGVTQQFTLTQRETILFMEPSGSVRPYLSINVKEVDNQLFFDRSKVKAEVLDKQVVKDLTGIQYAKLKEYATANDLSFEDKEDLLKILAYYDALD